MLLNFVRREMFDHF